VRKYIVLLGAFAAMLTLAGTSSATGPKLDQLQDAGWTCFRDPAAPRMVCSDPGHGRPIIGDPNPPATYNFKIFTLEGDFVGTTHLIRSDLYAGQPCPQTGGQYFLITALGYYRCEHF
jgi:hypothetical protein